MLISRLQGEHLVLKIPGYPDVWITVTEIRNRQPGVVRLGIEADQRIVILRSELLDERNHDEDQRHPPFDR